MNRKQHDRGLPVKQYILTPPHALFFVMMKSGREMSQNVCSVAGHNQQLPLRSKRTSTNADSCLPPTLTYHQFAPLKAFWFVWDKKSNIPILYQTVFWLSVTRSTPSSFTVLTKKKRPGLPLPTIHFFPFLEFVTIILLPKRK